MNEEKILTKIEVTLYAEDGTAVTCNAELDIEPSKLTDLYDLAVSECKKNLAHYEEMVANGTIQVVDND